MSERQKQNGEQKRGNSTTQGKLQSYGIEAGQHTVALLLGFIEPRGSGVGNRTRNELFLDYGEEKKE